MWIADRYERKSRAGVGMLPSSHSARFRGRTKRAYIANYRRVTAVK